jgi:hypothetical protein
VEENPPIFWKSQLLSNLRLPLDLSLTLPSPKLALGFIQLSFLLKLPSISPCRPSRIMMADVHPVHMEPSQPRQIPQRSPALQIPPPSTVGLPPLSSSSRIRNSHLALDSFSPVNQNGSFEFDRVLKSGFVQKRTRKTKVRYDSRITATFILIPSVELETNIPGPAS